MRQCYTRAAMRIQALLFDFDGLILDTETPQVEVWKAIYAEHGFDYPVEDWCQTIGGWGISTFDPAVELSRRSSIKLDAEALRRRGEAECNAVIDASPAMPGVGECLTWAKAKGLRLAIASSSERAWVEPHLARLGLLGEFEKVITGDDVAAGRTKPHPDVFLKALSELRLGADAALVVEDSPHGIAAAHEAGLPVLAIPNPVTRLLPMQGADLILESLAEIPLQRVLEHFDDTAPSIPPGDILHDSRADSLSR
jgi:HAD superfamily hydrolase (TIGR01509 family)